MMKLRLPAFIFAFVIALTPAYAQWQVDSGAVPLGRGVGQTGFNKAAGASGAGTKCLTDTTPPSFATCGSSLPTIANNTLLANTSGSSATPVQTTPGGLWDSFCSTGIGQSWVRLSGGWGCTSLGYANPVWWGADATCTTSSSAALLSAIATGLPIEWPKGCFTINQQIVISFTAFDSTFAMHGASAGLTKLKWTSATGGIQFNGSTVGAGYSKNTVDMRRMTLVTTQAGGGNAIYFNTGSAVAMPFSVLEDLVIQGDDFPAAADVGHYWNTAIYTHAWEDIIIERVVGNGRIAANPQTGQLGVGVLIEGDSATSTYTQQIRINHSNFNFYLYSVQLNSYWQGVSISKTGMGAVIPILVPGSQTGSLVQLNVDNSIFYGQSAGLVTNTHVDQMQISFNNLIIANLTGTVGGFILGTSSQAMIIGNSLNGTSTGGGAGNAVVMGGSNGVVIGNTFFQMAGGVVFQSGATGNTCLGNTYLGMTSNCSQAGSGNNIGVATQ